MMLFVPLFLCLSCTKPTKTICGVPVQGTPWELAAALYNRGVQEQPYFFPECVESATGIQAYIEGWYNSEEFPIDTQAEIVCDLDSTGQVVNAAIVIGDEIVEVCKE